MSELKIDYANKRVLLIESSGNMRSTVVYMLRQLGVSNIEAVTINEQVLDLIREEVFDIVLLGHNSSDSLSGIQLLEESRYRGYIKPGACWVFMTSDSSQEIILHALESKPDAVITKPFTMEELKARLDLLMYRKEALAAVDEAVSRGQLDKAVKLCDQVELSGGNYDYVQRIKGRLLLQMNRFDEAEHFFKYRFKHFNEKESGIALAEAYIGQGRLDEAKILLTDIIEKYPLLMSAYDLLADVLERQGELVPAQEALHSATKKSPLSLLRHMELGRVAVYTKTLPLAESAYRKSISLGKESCYRSADPYLKLANVRRLEMEGASERDQIVLRNQFDEILNHASFQFPKDKTLKFKSALLKSQLSRDLGETDDANRYLQEAERQAKVLGEEANIKRALLEVTGDQLPVLQEEAVDVVQKRQIHDPEMSERVNRLGVKHYMAEKVPQAIRYFGLAIEHDPKNAKALLNLAQLFLESTRSQSARREERIKMVERYLRLTTRMNLSEAEKQKYLLLEKLSGMSPEVLPDGSFGPLLR